MWNNNTVVTENDTYASRSGKLMPSLAFCSAETLSELRENLKAVIEALSKAEGSVTSISSGCELFLRFITLASLDNPVCNTLLYKAVYVITC